MDELFNKIGRTGVWILALPTLATGVIAVVRVARDTPPNLEVAAPFLFFMGFLLSCAGLANVDKNARSVAFGFVGAVAAVVGAVVVLAEERRMSELFFSLLTTALGGLGWAKQCSRA